LDSKRATAGSDEEKSGQRTLTRPEEKGNNSSNNVTHRVGDTKARDTYLSGGRPGRSKRSEVLENQLLRGGDFSNRLSDIDIDNALGHLPNYIPSRRFYAFRAEEDPKKREELRSQLRQLILQLLKKYEVMFMPVHVRDHWTTAYISATVEEDGIMELKPIVYDSAPSHATKRDLQSLFEELWIGNWRYDQPNHLTAPEIICHSHQPSGSDECGLHPILIELLHRYSKLPTKRNLNADGTYYMISLDPWRRILQRFGSGPIPRSMDLDIELLSAIPDLAHLVTPEMVTSGTIGLCKMCNRSGVPLAEWTNSAYAHKQHTQYTGVCQQCKSHTPLAPIGGGVELQLRSAAQRSSPCQQCFKSKPVSEIIDSRCRACREANAADEKRQKEKEREERDRLAKSQQQKTKPES
jgi:hypothetical protein